jgi:carboxylate-amine ligase
LTVPTVGVEEEFLLVDPSTGAPVERAAAVLAEAVSRPPAAPDAAVHAELLTSQVEAATGVCGPLAELRRQLHAGRAQLAAAAAAHGALLISSGTPVLAGPRPPAPTPGARFERISQLYQGIVADYQACGCHVHVEVPDREHAVAVVDHLAPWLPMLLALSVNSPYQRGVDTGYASWRMVLQSRFPGSGIAPWFGSAAAYDEQVARLVDCGVLADAHMSFWLARPSGRFPTVEFRVADAAGTAAGAVLQAALSRALVQVALHELAAGREAAPVDRQLAAAAIWTAARYGPSGSGVDLRTNRAVPVGWLLDELITAVTPALEDSGDLATVRHLVTGLPGAEWQRRAGCDGPLRMVRMLADRTLEASIPELSGQP